MGGFLAILFSGPLKAKRVLAFAPQFSVKPDILPLETRWTVYRSKIKTWRYPSLKRAFAPGIAYYTLNGGDWTERAHWENFQRGTNRHHFICRDFGHDIAAELKNANVLEVIVQAAMQDRLSQKDFLPVDTHKLGRWKFDVPLWKAVRNKRLKRILEASRKGQ